MKVVIHHGYDIDREVLCDVRASCKCSPIQDLGYLQHLAAHSTYCGNGRAIGKMKKKITDEVLKEANQIAEQLGLDLNIPRIVGRQQHRSNHPATNSAEFWRRSLIIPYLDSITSSLELRVSTENTPAYALTNLHPFHMLLIKIDELKEKTATFYSIYHLEGIEEELELWYKIWKDKNCLLY